MTIFGVDMIDFLAAVFSSIIVVGLLGIWLALRYGGDHPLRAARDCIWSLFNIWIAMPILSVFRGEEAWKARAHSPEYLAALADRREREVATRAAREQYIDAMLDLEGVLAALLASEEREVVFA